MGQRVTALASQSPRFEVVAALESANHPDLGKDAGLLAGVGEIGVPLGVVGESDADVVIDFSVPAAAVAVVAHCLEFKRPVVVATTGLEKDQQDYLRKAAKTDSDRLGAEHEHGSQCGDEVDSDRCAKHCAICRVALTWRSLSVITASRKIRRAARRLNSARLFRRRWGRRQSVHGREGRPGKRPQSEIGYHAVRTGDNPGEHTIVFGMLGETLELRVAASNRDCYAQGALLAAEWLAKKPPGLYGMNDVLGL